MSGVPFPRVFLVARGKLSPNIFDRNELMHKFAIRNVIVYIFLQSRYSLPVSVAIICGVVVLLYLVHHNGAVHGTMDTSLLPPVQAVRIVQSCTSIDTRPKTTALSINN